MVIPETLPVPPYRWQVIGSRLTPLDYIASAIAEITLGLSEEHHCYLPIACENPKAFEQHLKQNLPGLVTADPDLLITLKLTGGTKSNVINTGLVRRPVERLVSRRAALLRERAEYLDQFIEDARVGGKCSTQVRPLKASTTEFCLGREDVEDRPSREQ